MANLLDGRFRNRKGAWKHLKNFSEYVESGKKVSQRGSVELNSREADLLKELHRSRNPTIVEKRRLARKISKMYLEREMSTNEISKATGIPQNFVINTMYMFGIPVRSRLEVAQSEEGRAKMSEIAKKRWENMSPSQKKSFTIRTHNKSTASRYNVPEQYAEQYKKIKRDLLSNKPENVEKYKRYLRIPGRDLNRMMNKAIEELIEEGKV